jgi:hypothetical protein
MSGQYQPLVPDNNDMAQQGLLTAFSRPPPPRTLVLCVPAEQAFLAGSAIKAIGDFPITHLAYAWTLTVKAGEEK